MTRPIRSAVPSDDTRGIRSPLEAGAGAVAVAVLVVLGLLGTSLAAWGSTGSRVRDTKDGFTFMLPKGWSQVSLNGSDVGSILGSAAKMNSTFKSLLSGEAKAAAQKGLQVFAVSSAIENSDFAPNLNIGVFSGAPSLAEMDAQVKIEWTSSGAKDVKVKEVHYRFGSAVQASYVLSTTSQEGPVTELQVYIVHGSKTYITTFTALASSIVTKAAATVMPTWQFLSKG